MLIIGGGREVFIVYDVANPVPIVVEGNQGKYYYFYFYIYLEIFGEMENMENMENIRQRHQFTQR